MAAAGVSEEQARLRAQQRVRAFLRRTVEGCQRLAALDHEYNLRASVQHGAVMAAMNETDMAGVRADYRFMEASSFRALMPLAESRRPPFFEVLSARQLQQRYGTAEGYYAGGVIDRFGGSFRPRKFLIGLARVLQKRGVRFFQQTEAQALDFPDRQVTVFCGNGATIRTDTLFMANAYARHINGDALERAIFEYDYVVEVELPEAAKILVAGAVLSDTRAPCFYARRHGRRLYMGYEETAETSPEIVREVALRTLDEGKRVFPALRCPASTTSGAHGPGGSTTRSMTIRSWSARTAGASSPSPRRPITATRWRCASDSSSATSLPFDAPAEERAGHSPTPPQRPAAAAVRRLPQGAPPAPRPALPGGGGIRSQ